ncbi:hypothetical protein ISU82_18220 [Leptospira borgpetersenii serovar Balcanica]|nr:hypothetical protein [Leptospira borgpetersenii serovar Balcanica]
MNLPLVVASVRKLLLRLSSSFSDVCAIRADTILRPDASLDDCENTT